PTEEIHGGCFASQFNQFAGAACRMLQNFQPDVIIAESMGSSADLIATLLNPLRKFHGKDLQFSPLTVVVDPTCALRNLNLEPGAKFSDKVSYIYSKQLEEADHILINKKDSVSPSRLA